jgi:hypothetical protein
LYIYLRYNSAMANKNPRKEVPLNIRVDASEKAAFVRASEVAGLPLSAWIRSTLRSAAFLQLDNVGEPVTFLRSRTK